MECPHCGKNLTIKKEATFYIFKCPFCGYSKKISAKSEKEAYEYVTLDKNVVTYRPEYTEQRTRSSETYRKTSKRALNVEYDLLPIHVKRIFKNPDLDIVHYKHLPQKLPDDEEIPRSLLPKELVNYLHQIGFKKLYTFQIEATKEILAGGNVVIVAPTGIGKTEAFLFPLLTKIWQENPNPLTRRGIKGILIYPTKALARDQLKKIQRYGKTLSITCKAFDGDTPQKEREQIYQYPPELLITNPDMLNYHLANPRFQSLIKTVNTVVIDEIHTFIGAFGSNLYFILKRLARITRAKIQFIGASATIGNAKEFAEKLFDSNVKLISLKEARKASTHLIMAQPVGLSQYTVTAELVDGLIRTKRKTLCFQNTHKNAEIVNILLKQRKIKSAVHRAGLTKKYRERVEKEFREGNLDALVATPTLELGIDIGDVDAVVSSIVEVTRFTQRLGRAGRRGQEAVGVLLLRNDDPISTFYTAYPELYFGDVANGYIEPKNEIVSYYQILAAALDKQLEKHEFSNFKDTIRQLMGDNYLKLASDNKLKVINRQRVRQMLRHYSIRGIGDNIAIKNERGEVIGERNMPIAARELHPGAIYLHGGKYYKSLTFEYDPQLSTGEAVVKEIPAQNKKTTAIRYAIPEILNILDTKIVFGIEAKYCDLEIIEYVVGYKVENIYNNEALAQKELDPPIEYAYKTKGFVFSVPKPTEILKKSSKIPEKDILMGSFHAVEHVLIESSSMLTGGGSSELGGISMGDSGVIFVYDGAKGGSGLSKLLYDRLEEAIRRSLVILEKCDCKTIDGCPRCTYSYQCGNNNQPLHKAGAIETFKLTISGRRTTIGQYDVDNSFI